MREAQLHTGYWMVMEVLLGEGALWNRRYVVGRTQCQLSTPTVRPQIEGEMEFNSLKGEVGRKRRPKLEREAWISKATWQLVDRRTALQRAGRVRKREVRKVWRDFQRGLQADKRQRVQAVGANIEGLLETGRVKEAWDQLTRWY